MIESSSRYTLRAGILSYVLAVSLLLSVGLSMLLLYIFYASMEVKSYERKTRLIQNLQAAQDITLGEYDYFDYDQVYYFDLYGDGLDSISIERKKWGVLDVYRIAAFRDQLVKQKIYSVGHIPDEKGRSTLFLVDDGRPLSVVGDTKLVGDCFLPLAGVQSAYINRIGYANEELIYGEKHRSNKELPEVQLDELYDELSKLRVNPADVTQDTLVNSFFHEPMQVSGTNLSLNGVYIGNIFIKGTGRIVFDSLSKTSDIVAFAPVIELKSGFAGDGQFFVTDTLIVHEDVRLYYPSVLAAYNEDQPATIQTRGKAQISGWILMDGEEDGFRRRVIYLEDGTDYRGMIFCNGLLEVYADIDGHVAAKRFLVNSPTAVYENYLFNTTIDATKLDSAFLNLSEWFYTNETRVLRYLE